MGSEWLYYHTLYCINPHKTLHALHLPSECICAFVYVFPIPWSSYIQTLGTCVHEKEALEITVLLLSEWRDVLGLSATGALVRLKTKLKWITFNVNANHIWSLQGLWNTCEDNCYHCSYPSKNISLWQQYDTILYHPERQSQSSRKTLSLDKQEFCLAFAW